MATDPSGDYSGISRREQRADARDIAVAENLARLSAAAESTGRAVEASHKLLEDHTREQKQEALIVNARMDMIEKRIAALENERTKEEAQREQVTRWAKAFHLVIGGVVTAALISGWNWLQTTISSGGNIRPVALALIGTGAALIAVVNLFI